MLSTPGFNRWNIPILVTRLLALVSGCHDTRTADTVAGAGAVCIGGDRVDDFALLQRPNYAIWLTVPHSHNTSTMDDQNERIPKRS